MSGLDVTEADDWWMPLATTRRCPRCDLPPTAGHDTWTCPVCEITYRVNPIVHRWYRFIPDTP